VLLIGGAVAFASQSLPKGNDPAAVGAPPPPPLTVLQPAAAITRDDHVDLTAVAPANLRPDQHYEVRIFVNGSPIGRMDLPDTGSFTIGNVPLDEGQNSVQTTLVGDGGESPKSAPVAISRDDQPPTITIIQPNGPVYTDTTMLTGKTEPGADLQITDAAGHPVDSSISADGRFSAELELGVGANDLTLRSTDDAGNKTTSKITVDRANSAASIVLSVTPTQLYAADLPATVELEATVRDELGRPLDGAEVIFAVSPPDRATTTYSATSSNGHARFTGVTLDPGETTGEWLVTASATLPSSGIQLRDDASFSLSSGAPRPTGH
jgi:bacillopeptidase F